MAPTDVRHDRWSYFSDELRIHYDEELGSIPNAVRVAAQRHPSLEALVDADLRLTFAGLETAMIESVRAAIAIGVTPGTRVGLWGPNSARWILAALGVLGAGGILVPINTRFQGDEAAFVLNKSGSSALLTVTDFLDKNYLGMLRAADPALAALQRVIVFSGDADGGTLSWSDHLTAGLSVSAEEAHLAIDAVGPDALSDIMFTSGTTGYPKGVMLTHGQSLRAHGWLAKVMGFQPGDRYLIVPPFFHTFGYKAGWMACVVHGATTIPQRVLDIGDVLKTIAAEKVTILCGPPTLFQDLLDAPNRADYDLSTLRITMASATFVPPGLIRRMRDELGVGVTHSGYGLTEATSLVTTTIPGVDDVDDIMTTVGRAALDVEVRVVDDAGNDVPSETPGELWVRGYNVMRGYWDAPDKTAEAITPEGWLRTGDVAVMDDRGFVSITDRKKDVVIVGGFNVYPAEVERILGAHPAVSEIAVVGMPDERMGEVPVAFVVPKSGDRLGEDEFRQWAGAKIANFKVPRRVIQIDSLPRNASMKVLKNQLRDMLTGLTVQQ
jgi:acyl-CoA synthetase (AMP-forming)/AMP-acid ligase II